jgi:hypothetical protein
MRLGPSAERSETPTVDGDEYVTMASAADIAGIPVTTLRQWVDSGRLPARVGQRGRLVRLADVQHLVAAGAMSPPNGAARPASAQMSVGRNDNVAAAAPGNGATAPGRTHTAAPSDDETADVGPDKTRAAEEGATTAPGTVEPAAVRQQWLAIVSNAAAFISKLDQLYRAQIAAKDGEIAAKAELIVELRRRAERAEQHAARLEQKLADLRAHAEVVETQPVPPAPHPGLLRRIMSWYRRL